MSDEGSIPRAGDWFTKILNFYQDFGEVLKASIADYQKNPTTSLHPVLPKAEFWKSNGDELLYTFEIVDPYQLVNVLILWKRSVLRYRELLRLTELDVKATAWSAGFPLMNTEVVFEEALSAGKPQGGSALARQSELRGRWHTGGNKRKGLTLDFIGPSIDIGFRLSQLSSADQMMVSLDIAYIIAKHVDNAFNDELPMYYDGARPLKGVLGGRPYPIFWIFVGSADAYKLQQAEDDLGGPAKPVVPSSAANFCQRFYTENSNYLISPFICKVDGSTVWGDKPPEYEKAIARLRETAGIDQKVSQGIDSAATSDGVGSTPDQQEVSRLIDEAVIDAPSKALKSQAPSQEEGDPKGAGDEG